MNDSLRFSENLVAVDDSLIALTERLILPHMEAIFRGITEVREALDLIVEKHLDVRLIPPVEMTDAILFFFNDPLLHQLFAVHRGKKNLSKYPIGACRPIRCTVLSYLEKAPVEIKIRFFPGVNEFVAAGGILKDIWGELHGQYFQNAIQLGHLYVDVANDTVDIRKPKTEWTMLSESGFSNITSFYVFADLLGRYHHKSIAVNDCLPELAPLCPLWSWRQNGQVKLEVNSAMLDTARSSDYQTSRSLMIEPPATAVPLPDWAKDRIVKAVETMSGPTEILEMTRLNTEGTIQVDAVFDRVTALPTSERDRRDGVAATVVKLLNTVLRCQ